MLGRHVSVHPPGILKCRPGLPMCHPRSVANVEGGVKHIRGSLGVMEAAAWVGEGGGKANWGKGRRGREGLWADWPREQGGSGLQAWLLEQ